MTSAQSNQNSRRTVWLTRAAIAAITALCTSHAPAQLVQPFTRGNLVVQRVGDGSAALNGNATAIFLDQYSPTGTFVSTVPIPTNGANAFVDTGNSTTEGFVSLSPTGTNVVIAGYIVPAGTAGPAAANAGVVPRAVATVDYLGNFNIVTNTTIGFTGGNVRSAATDGNGNYWGSGSVVGMFYFGVNGPTNYISTTVANERVIQVINGDIYFSTGSGTHGIYKVTGTPTTSGNAAVNIFGASSTAPLGFSFSPAMDQAYMVDSTAFSTSSGPGGIEKWTNSLGAWTFLYSLAPAADGVAVDWSTTPPTIYATVANGSALVKVVDTGAGAAIVTNAVAATNTAFRSVTFAPTNSVILPSAPNITGINPTSQTISLGSTATITLSGSAGNPVASNNWYFVSGITTNIVSHSLSSVTLSNLAVGSYSVFAIATNSIGSSTSSVATVTVSPKPVITAITPSLIATNPGSKITFTLTAIPGVPAASNFWFKVSGGTTNPVTDGVTGSGSVISGSTTTSLTLSNVALVGDAAGYFAILSNSSGTATSPLATLIVSNFPPAITSITPAAITNNAGQTASFTVTNSGTPPFTYFWYKETATATNLLSVQASPTLSLANITGNDTANYQVVVSNATSFVATSSVVSLTVTNDPNIESQPSSTHGLLNGTVNFSVSAAGAGLTYQWWFADQTGAPVAAIGNGVTATGSTITGANSPLLTIANLAAGDAPTNVFVVVNGTFGGPLTSIVASLLDVTNHANLAFWDFNGVEFTNTIANPTSLLNPVPYIGYGTATAVGSTLAPPTTPFSGSVDANDGLGFTSHLPPFSWGTSTYPLVGSNKQNGVQFNVSTIGAKNIKVSYESRVSATASDYERLQYTTNGTDWTDYPSSSSFNGVGVTYLPYSYDLSGFPGVANNPNFGVRVVTEFITTATYGLSLLTNQVSTNYVGTANTYGSSGTVTYDLVTISADAITNANIPAVFTAGFTDTNTSENQNLDLNFSIGAGTTPADSLTYSAVSLNNKVTPQFTFSGSGANRNLHIVPNTIPDQVDAAPIVVTVTDAAGDVAKAWFVLTVTSLNLAPTNSLVFTPGATNTLANTPVTVPFTVGDDHTAPASLTYTVTSDNNTLVPVANVVVSNTVPSNPTVTITPAPNQLGVALITVTVNDNDSVEPKSTTANLAVAVRPNTNIVAIDYFTYDGNGSLDVVGANFWKHLSGNFGQLKVLNGSAVVDTFANTENLQTALLGAPYRTNVPPVTPTMLFASYIVNMSGTQMPFNNGSYFTMFNDGSLNTADVEGCVVAATNGAAPGMYRLGIANIVGATALNSQMFPMDLTPGVNYAVIESLNVTNGQSTLWVAPTDASSPSVTDTQSTTLYNMTQFEFRESGAVAGTITVSRLKVGTTFDSVFPSLTISTDGTNAIVNSSDSTLMIQGTTNIVEPFIDLPGATLPYTNAPGGANFFRFKQ